MADPTPREALDALLLIRAALPVRPVEGSYLDVHFKTVEHALESAAKEAECWAVIDEWRAVAARYRRPVLGQLHGGLGDKWWLELSRSDGSMGHVISDKKTRIEALTAAAEWIKQQEQR